MRQLRVQENIRVGLFFTEGVGLDTWKKNGSLSRELALYHGLKEHGITYSFFTYSTRHNEHRISTPAQVYHRPRFIPSILYSILLPFIRIRALRSQVLLKTNQLKGAWAAVIAKKLVRRPLLVRAGYEWLSLTERLERPLWLRWFVYKIEKFAYKNANYIILTSIEQKNFVVDRFGVAAEKIIVVPNYIDTDVFSPEQVDVCKSRTLITVARLEKEKNIANLIRAIDGVDVTLHICGEGSLRRSLEQLANEITTARVIFHGNVPNENLPAMLRAATIFILPSLFEGNPKALLEAMSVEIPVIGTDVSGIIEIIDNGENGLLCAPTPSSIRAAVTRLLDDGVLRKELAHNARQTIISDYSLTAIMRKELAVYSLLV